VRVPDGAACCVCAIQFNVVREEIADPAEGPLRLQPAFWSKVIRFQTGF
jgi:hypothetical protein